MTAGTLEVVDVQFMVEKAYCVLVPNSTGSAYVQENISIVFETVAFLLAVQRQFSTFVAKSQKPTRSTKRGM